MTIHPTDDLMPCPFCGCKNVYTYICFDTAVCRCQDCGAQPSKAAVTVMYKRGNPPKELEGVPTYEAAAFAIKNNDESLTEYPDHGYVGVSAPLAFKAFGVTERWNRRAA